MLPPPSCLLDRKYITVIDVSIGVLIDTRSCALSCYERSLVDIAIGELERANTILIVLSPVAFVSRTIDVGVHTLSMLLTFSELPFIPVFVLTDHNSVAVNLIVVPLAVVLCAGGVEESTLTILRVVLPFAFVAVTEAEEVYALTRFLSVHPIT